MKNNKKNQSNKDVTNILQPESNFIIDVETHAASANISIIDAILNWLQKRNIEIEQIVPLIKTNSKFKKKLTLEAKELNWLK